MSFNPYSEWLDIPPDEQPPDHYRLLDLEPGEDDSVRIRAAEQSVIFQLKDVFTGEHPDEMRELYRQIKDARETLLDPQLKQEYDIRLFGTRPQLASFEPEELADLNSNSATTGKSGKKRGSIAGTIGMIVAIVLGPISAAGLFYLVTGNSVTDLVSEQPAPAQVQPPIDKVVQADPKTEPTDDETQVGNLDRLRQMQNSRGSTTPQKASALPKAAPNEQNVPEKSSAATPVVSDGSVQFPKAAVAITTPQTNPSRNSTSTPPKIEQKPVPPAAERDAAREKLTKLYQRQIDTAETFPARMSLAKEIARVADAPGTSAAEQFVLLELAIDQTIATARLNETNDAIAALTARFDLPDFGYRAKAFQEWADALPDDFKGDERKIRHFALGVMATELAEDAGHARHYDIAGKMFRLASYQLRQGGDSDRARETTQQARHFESLQKKRDSIAGALTALEQDRDNPELNTQVAELLCFQLEQWDEGLPYLSRGTDSALHAPAKHELNSDGSTEQTLAIADEWWTVAESRKLAQKKTLRRHAVELYESVIHELIGLPRQLALNRMKEIGPVSAFVPVPTVHFDFEKKHVEQLSSTIQVENLSGDLAHGRSRGIGFNTGDLDNWAAYFPVGSWIESPNTDKLIRPDQGFTISIWVKPDRQAMQSVAGKYTDCFSSSQCDFGLGLNADGTVYSAVNFSGSSRLLVRGDEVVPVDLWTHLAMTWDRRELKTFVNGEPIGSSRAFSDDEPNIRTQYDYVLSAPSPTNSRSRSRTTFSGAMDEARLYKRGLSETAILHLFLLHTH